MVDTEVAAPKRAFASYAEADSRFVKARLRSLKIATRMDIFDYQESIDPGDEWQPLLRSGIKKSDVFWLFWSRNAKKSNWVDYEWRTALALKSLSFIQPHPLEPWNLAPPPDELQKLQFGTKEEWDIYLLYKLWPLYKVLLFWQRLTALFRKK